MRVKLVLPALTEARSPYWRRPKHSLAPLRVEGVELP